MLGGTSTPSITWMTPLLASTSVAVTVTLPFSVTPSVRSTVIYSPCTVATGPSVRSVDMTSPETTW